MPGCERSYLSRCDHSNSVDSVKGDEYGIGFTMLIPYDERDDVFTSVCYFTENILVKTFSYYMPSTKSLFLGIRYLRKSNYHSSIIYRLDRNVSWQGDYHCISRSTTYSKNCMMKMIRDRKTKMRPHNTDAFLVRSA